MIFHEVPYADTALRLANGTTPRGRKPHQLAGNDNEAPFRGRRISIAEMLTAMTPESLAIRAMQLAANDNHRFNIREAA